MYQALEYDYYFLQEGDTVVVQYNADARPILTSLVFDNNTKLYNLPYDLPKAIQFQGYFIETVLNYLGVSGYFDFIVDGFKVKVGKPAPDIYAYACEQLELAPDQTFAVEDSPNGVTSAYLAGCNVIMVPDLTQPDENLKIKLYACVDSLMDITKLL